MHLIKSTQKHESQGFSGREIQAALHLFIYLFIDFYFHCAYGKKQGGL